jgi:hypothetical protein
VTRSSRAVARLAIGCAVLASACTAQPDLDGPAGPLTGVCPDPVVIQTDWLPRVEHGGLYEMLEDEGVRIDAERALVRGRIVVGGVDQGVVLEVRSGGPAVEHTDVPRLLHEDPEILLGVVATDQQLRLAHRFPTVGVVTMLERDPLMIMWDPSVHDVEQIADLPPGTEISVFGPGLFVDHLLASGAVAEAQLTYTRTGGPERFVDAEGAIAQQGTATYDPFTYLLGDERWRRPVRFELLHDTGWQPYAGVLAATPEALDQDAACLAELVPLLQRSMVAFRADPSGTTRLLMDLLDRDDAGWGYQRGHAEWSAEQLRVLSVMADSPRGVAGGFDEARVTGFLDRAVPLLGRGQDLTADDLVTGRFLDAGVGFGPAGG